MISKPMMTASGIILISVGAIANFMPVKLAIKLGLGEPKLGGLLFQILAGFLLGLGIINWMYRGSPIGGIYNRPVAMGNLLTFVVVSFALGRALLDGFIPVIYTSMFIVTFILALGFIYLVIFCDGLEDDAS